MNKLIKIVVAAIAATTPLFSSSAFAEKSNQILFGYCEGYSRGLGAASVGTIEKAAIEIPGELAQKWAGNKLTQIYVGFGTSSNNEISVFIGESLEADPIYTQSASIEQQGGWNVISLATPFEITGEGFIVGYGSYIKDSGDKPIGIDDLKNSNPYSSWIEIDGDWSNYSQFFGDVCIKIMLEGENLPQNEVVVESAEAPELVQINTSFMVQLNLINNGAQAVNSLTATYTIGEETYEVPSVTFPDGSIASQSTGTVLLSGILCDKSGKQIPLTLNLGLVNGEENESDLDTSITVAMDCAEKCFPQNMVVEEYTGTWCGWCPRGIVGMNYMKENYGNKGFIGIAVHYGDEMQTDSYAPLADSYSQSPGYPLATANREEVFDPSIETLMEQYNLVTSLWSPAEIMVKAQYNEEENILKASAVSEYSFDLSDTPYSLAFIITENNIGPYLQKNYFTGGQLGQTLEGWTDKPLYVATIYDEVARDIKDLYGIEGSLPSEIKAYTPYSYSTELPLGNVTDINNCKVAAVIIDNKTGKIVNGDQTDIEKYTGVHMIITDQDVFKVYNPQGLKVMETKDISALKALPNGIYIINGRKVIL